MVDHDRQVSLAFADRDLVEPEALEVREQVALAGRLGADTLADPPDRPPRDPHQQADRRLARVHRQPRGLILERPGEPRVVPRPRDRRDEHPVALALHSGRVRLDVRLLHPQPSSPGSYPYASLAHAATAPFQRGSDLQAARTLGAPRRAHPNARVLDAPRPNLIATPAQPTGWVKRRQKRCKPEPASPRTATPTKAALDE